MKYCEKCGNELFDEAVVCPKCGCPAGKSQTEQVRNDKAKSTSVATFCFLGAAAIIIITILLAIAQYNSY